jgi:hypothetical protein
MLVTPSFEVWDPNVVTVVSSGSLIRGRWTHAATRLNSGNVLITGGDTGFGLGILASSEIYTPLP